MPNADSNEEDINVTNKLDNLTAIQQPTTSLDTLSTSPARDSELELPVVHSTSRAIHSDPEESITKVKTRSRFSSAIRKLSRSTRKKDKPVIKSLSLPSDNTENSQEPVVSSDADADQSPKDIIKPKKKKKSIFHLKKSKVAPKKDTPEIKALEPLFQDRENEVIVTTERLSPGEGTRKVQITIKSKKIEKVATAEQVQDKPSSPPPPPPTHPQTLPTSTSTTSPTVHTSSTPSPPSRRDTNESLDKNKKKLKTRVVTQTSQKSTTPSAAQSKAKAEKEIAITQCAKDTPPREKAPAKPSRLVSTAVGSASHAASHLSNSSGALRKTATSTRAAVKLVSAAKAKAKTSATATAATGASNKAEKPGKTTESAATGAAKEDTDLMINPQRGHRYPRPNLSTSESKEKSHGSQATTTIIPQSTASLPTSAISNSSNHTQQQQQHSPSLSSFQPQATEIQSVSSVPTNASLQLAPGRSISQTVLDEEVTINNSVPTQPQQQTDDHISLAESVQTSELSGDLDSTKHSQLPLQQQSKDDNAHVSPTVRFALGTRVRPPLIAKQLAYEPSSQEPYSIEQHSDDSETPDSEDSHRRRIHYISQPSLYEEFNSLEQKRTHYRYQSGVSDLSLDVDDSAEDTLINSQNKQMPAFGDLTMDQEMEPTIMTSTNAEKREHLYKILVIGELGTGKTSFIKRYVHQFFSQNYRATIGVDFALKVLHWDPNTIVRLQLWDIAGQERFGNMTRVYYKEAVGAFIVFDVTRSGTFDCVSKWKEDLDSKVQLPDGSPIPCILLANKCDQDKQGVVTNSEKMDEYVKEHGFAGWFETSAKENINIDEAARALVNKILLNDKLISASDLADSERFNLDHSGDQTLNDAKNKCSC